MDAAEMDWRLYAPTQLIIAVDLCISSSILMLFSPRGPQLQPAERISHPPHPRARVISRIMMQSPEGDFQVDTYTVTVTMPRAFEMLFAVGVCQCVSGDFQAGVPGTGRPRSLTPLLRSECPRPPHGNGVP